MRRLLALTALAAAVAVPSAAHASYECVPDANADNGVCVQVASCRDECLIDPGVQFHCYLGFSGERFCRVVRALSVGSGG